MKPEIHYYESISKPGEYYIRLSNETSDAMKRQFQGQPPALKKSKRVHNFRFDLRGPYREDVYVGFMPIGITCNNNRRNWLTKREAKRIIETLQEFLNDAENMTS
jgi:hypothetical protein